MELHWIILGACCLFGCVMSTKPANDHKVTTNSAEGLCFYGRTAARVFNLLAFGRHRNLLQNVKPQAPKSCSELKKYNYPSNVYTIYPDGGPGFKVYCDMVTDGGGWTVLVRRMDGSVDFTSKRWKDYENGFGNLKGEFWLGLKYQHRLTALGKTEMRVDMENFKKEKKYAKYSVFSVGGMTAKYKLTVNGFQGNAGNSFTYHNGLKFTTSDQDNDNNKGNCAAGNGGWWYGTCDLVAFTKYYATNKSGKSGQDCIQWETWKGSEHSLKYADMKIRRV